MLESQGIKLSDRKMLSIVTVVKNDADGFKKTLDSLLNPPWRNMELIVIDSSESDGIAKKIASMNFPDGAVKYFWVEPKGIYSAMNIGLDYAQGSWTWFLNAGDVLNPRNSLIGLITELEKYKSFDAVAFPVEHLLRDCVVWAVSFPEIVKQGPKMLFEGNHQGFVAKTSAIIKYGKFDESFVFAADSKLMDQFAEGDGIFISDSYLCQFAIGGASGVNFTQVLREISEHRNLPITLSVKCRSNYLAIKNSLRLRLANSNSQFFIRTANFLVWLKQR